MREAKRQEERNLTATKRTTTAKSRWMVMMMLSMNSFARRNFSSPNRWTCTYTSRREEKRSENDREERKLEKNNNNNIFFLFMCVFPRRVVPFVLSQVVVIIGQCCILNCKELCFVLCDGVFVHLNISRLEYTNQRVKNESRAQLLRTYHQRRHGRKFEISVTR